MFMFAGNIVLFSYSLAFHLSRLKNDPIRVSCSLPPSPLQFLVSSTSGDRFMTPVGLQSEFLFGPDRGAGGRGRHFYA